MLRMIFFQVNLIHIKQNNLIHINPKIESGAIGPTESYRPHGKKTKSNSLKYNRCYPLLFQYWLHTKLVFPKLHVIPWLIPRTTTVNCHPLPLDLTASLSITSSLSHTALPSVALEAAACHPQEYL